MKTALLVTTFVLVSSVLISCSKDKPKTENEKILYTVGLNLGKNLSKLNLTKDEVPFVIMGIKDEVLKNEPAVNIDEYQPKVNELFLSRIETQASGEKQKGEAFTEAFMQSNPEAKKLNNGLVILITKASDGSKPKMSDTVLIRYTGKLTDGKIFDTTDTRSEPASLPLTRVIKGWQIALQKMNVGSEATVIIPANLAYGDAGAPPNIAPGATLVFNLDLIGIADTAVK